MRPTDAFVKPTLTDLYELTMAYGYWKNGKERDKAVFDLFFRKNPFGGEFTIFAGLEEVIRSLHAFRFTDSDIAFLRDGTIKRKAELEYGFETGLKNGFVREKDGSFEEFSFDQRGIGAWQPVARPRGDLAITGPMAGCDPAFFDWLKQPRLLGAESIRYAGRHPCLPPDTAHQGRRPPVHRPDAGDYVPQPG